MSDKERLIQIFEHAVNKAWGEGFDYIDLSTRDGKKILELLKEDEQFGNAEQFAKDNNVSTNWISVKDRLPEVRGSYIVAGKQRFSKEPWEYFTDVAVSDGDYIDGFWDTFKCWNEGEGQETHITHWMPLPEPPKEEV